MLKHGVHAGSYNDQENWQDKKAPVIRTFFNKAESLPFFLKKIPSQVFFFKSFNFFRNSYSLEHLCEIRILSNVHDGAFYENS